MTTPVRLQLSRRKGFNLQEYSRSVNGLEAVNVARPTIYGNPFKWREGVEIGGGKGRGEGWAKTSAVALFREAWTRELRSANTPPRHPPAPFGHAIYLGPLKGKNLACWCALSDCCHADVLLELANAEPCE